MTLTGFLILLTSLALLATLILLWRNLRLMRLLDQLETQLEQLPAPPRPATLPASENRRTRLITIEILNPMELAARESRFAQLFGGLTPALVRQQVIQQAAARIRAQLEAEGVEADLRIVRAA
jgi:hypothetical protein